jgi:hypothetical protein
MCGILAHDEECAKALDAEMNTYSGFDAYCGIPSLFDEAKIEECQAKCLMRHKVERICKSCLRPAPLERKCSGCQSVVYCDAKCQLANWPIHKLECRRGQQKVICPCIKGRDLVLWAKRQALQCAHEGCTKPLLAARVRKEPHQIPCMLLHAQKRVFVHAIGIGFCAEHKD